MPRWSPVLMFLVACRDPKEETPADSDAPVDSPAAAEAPVSGWPEATSWALAEVPDCPPTLEDGELLTELTGALGYGPTDPGIPRSFFRALGGNYASDPSRLSGFHDLIEDPTLLVCQAEALAMRADAALASDHPLATLLADATAELDLAPTVGGPWATEGIDWEAPLVDAVARLQEDGWDRADAEAQAASVPLSVQRDAALILLAVAEAAEARAAGLDALGLSERLTTIYARLPSTWLLSTRQDLEPDDDTYAALYESGQEGHATLYAGAVRLAQAIDEAELAAADEEFSFAVDTPLGAVVIRGGGDDRWDPAEEPLLEQALLGIDTGGDDTYLHHAGGTTSDEHGVAVHLDLGGDDAYGYDEVGSEYDQDGLLPADEDGRYAGDESYGPFTKSEQHHQGSGVLGYGMLVDLGAGADTYRALRGSQGFGATGVGLLYDDGGDDSYTGEAGVQGVGITGIGLLVDRGGGDTYRSFTASQGHAWIVSNGKLWDGGGDDHYELVVDDPLIYFSGQLPGIANASLGQGTAFGWRRDEDGDHRGGGLALLRDVAGADRYDGAVFAQGVGYWMGLGVLADSEGDDRYNGMFYAQAAAAHFGLGVLLEGGGDDTYNADHHASQSMLGLGHDFSVSALIERAGDDVYTGPDRSLGAGKCHGAGLFVELSGDDQYLAEHDRTIGWATDYDWALSTCGDYTDLETWGLFLDADGADTYVKPGAEGYDDPGYGDDAMWLGDDPTDTEALEIMGGIDATGGRTFADGAP